MVLKGAPSEVQEIVTVGKECASRPFGGRGCAVMRGMGLALNGVAEYREASMQTALRVTFRGMDTSDNVKRAVEAKVSALETFSSHLITCDVAVSRPNSGQHKGQLYRCRIDLRVPGAELVVGGHPDKNAAHEDVYVAIRDAFKAVRRELQDYERRRRHH